MQYFKIFDEFKFKNFTIHDLENIQILWINEWHKKYGIEYKPELDNLIENNLLSKKVFNNKGKQEERYFATPELMDIINKNFVGKTIQKTCNICKKLFLEGYDKQLSLVPLKVFLMFNDPVEEAFSKIDDRCVDVINYGFNDRIVDKLVRTRKMKDFNYYKMFKHFFPEIPEKIKLYRGIKSLPNQEYSRIYSSWTYKLDQAERFSKYHFVKHSWEKPIEAKTQVILETEITPDKVLAWIGGHEGEVILRNSDITYTHKIIKQEN